MLVSGFGSVTFTTMSLSRPCSPTTCPSYTSSLRCDEQRCPARPSAEYAVTFAVFFEMIHAGGPARRRRPSAGGTRGSCGA